MTEYICGLKTDSIFITLHWKHILIWKSAELVAKLNRK